MGYAEICNTEGQKISQTPTGKQQEQQQQQNPAK